MFPEEVQATMAKVLFFVFATCLLCFSRARAGELGAVKKTATIVYSSTIH